MVTPYLFFLGALALERAWELRLSARNARGAFARGAIEYGRGHLPAMCALHACFLFSCALEVVLWHRPFRPVLGAGCLVVALFAQALRYWAIASLGGRWNTRVIVEPGVAVVVRGPYRFLRHPNYVAVVLEGVAVPMVHGAWLTAIVFSTLNAALLAVRIRCEERALRSHCGYETRLAARPRFLPRWSVSSARS